MFEPRIPYIEIIDGDDREAVKLLSDAEIEDIARAFARNEAFYLRTIYAPSHYVPSTYAQSMLVELNTFCPFFRDALPTKEMKIDWDELNQLINELPIEERIGVSLSKDLWVYIREAIGDIRAPDESYMEVSPSHTPRTCVACGKESRYIVGVCDLRMDCREKIYKKKDMAVSA